MKLTHVEKLALLYMIFMFTINIINTIIFVILYIHFLPVKIYLKPTGYSSFVKRGASS